MRAYALTPARKACRRLCGPAERNASGGASGQWSLKTVWGVGYKFEVVSGA